MKTLAKWLAIGTAAVALVVLGVVIGGGGSDDAPGERAAKAEDASRGDRAAENAARDDDGDGVLNTYDPEPDDPAISSYEEVENEPEPSPEPDPTDCDSLGINAVGLKEGPCTDAGTGQRIKVVNKDTTLRLPEMNVRYLGATTAPTIGSDIGSEAASGTFLILRLEITNKTNAPVTIEPDGIELTLTRRGRTRTYTHDFDAENLPGDSFVWIGDELQPGAAVTGTVVFDVPTRFASELDRTGNLVVLQFSDVDSFDAPQRRIGVIRTYN